MLLVAQSLGDVFVSSCFFPHRYTVNLLLFFPFLCICGLYTYDYASYYGMSYTLKQFATACRTDLYIFTLYETVFSLYTTFTLSFIYFFYLPPSV